VNQEYLTTVLLGPIVSEKSTRIGDQGNQVVFKVRTEARKLDIKRAVEAMFEVEVANVNVLNVKGKAKGMGRVRGKRSDWKKAYVTLSEGHDIDFMGAD
jgi:large subunit ribosomal protein L23